jgi:hypothetical protein
LSCSVASKSPKARTPQLHMVVFRARPAYRI